MQGLSGRAYAKHQGVAVKTVQRWKRDGWLVLYDDGSIDAAASDLRVAERYDQTTAPESPLVAARQRKLAVQVATLEDEVATIRSRLIPPDDAVVARRIAFSYCARELQAIATAGAALAGQPVPAVKERLSDVVRETLTRLSTADPLSAYAGDAGDDPAPAAGEPVGVDLAARRTALQAERLELRRGRERGELLGFDAHVRDLQGKFGTARARLLALPNKMAPRLAGQDPKAAAAELRQAIIGDVIAELAGPLPGIGDLSLGEILAEAEAGGG